MIDTGKYEGQTKGHKEVGWRVNNNFVSNGECPNDIYIAYVRRMNANGDVYEVIEFSDADAQLIADAPLLLAELKRLQRRNEWLEEVVALTQEHGGIDLSDYGWPQWREEE